MTKEQMITEFVKAVARQHATDQQQFDILMRVAIVTKHIADGILYWDEELEGVAPTNSHPWLH